MSLAVPTRAFGDMFTEAQEARDRGGRVKAYGEGVTPEVAEAVAKGGGRNWWLKPSVMFDLIDAASTPEDWAYIGKMAGSQASNFSAVRAGLDRIKARDLAEAFDDGGITGSIGRIGKGVIRTSMAVLESGYQEIQGVGRTAAAPSSRLPGGGRLGIPGVQGKGAVGSQSSLGIMLEKLVDGEIGVDDILLGSESALGKGYFTGGDVRVEQARRAYESAHIDGHALTLGRLAAHQVSEPGTRAYNIISGFVDAGAIIVADPTNIVLGQVGKGIKAAKYFDAEPALGLVRGNRRTVTENVGRWLDGNDGRKFIDGLTGEFSPVKVLDASNGTLPVEAAVAIANTSDPARVRQILNDTLGLTSNRIPRAGINGWHFSESGLAIRHRVANTRIFANMPVPGRLDRTDPEQFVEHMRAQLLNARVPKDKVDELTNNAMRAAVSGPGPGFPLPTDQFDVIVSVKNAVKESLVANGVPRESARNITQLWDGFEHMRTYNIDAMTSTERILPDGVTIAGKELPAPTPQAAEQFLGRYVMMPDMQVYREIRTRVSHLSHGMSKLGGVGETLINKRITATLALDSVMKTWKPLQLLRGAYVLRVGGDEQARMAGAGLSSLFTRHPVSFLSIAMADDGRIAKLLDSIPGFAPGRMGVDFTGAKFSSLDEESEFANTLYRTTTELLGQSTKSTVKAPGFIPIRVGEGGYVESWADGLKFLHDNPIASRLAKGEPLADVQQFFWDSSYRKAIGGSSRNTDMAPLAAQVSTRAGADRYVAETMQTWIDDVTQGDARLIDFIANGSVGGTTRIHKNFEMTKEGKAFLESMIEEGVRPEHVIGSPQFQVGRTAGKAYDEFVNHMFDIIATKPANWASRSPTFKQFFWKRGEALLADATPEAKAALLDVARGEAKLSKSHIKRLEAIDARGVLAIEDLNTLSMHHAAKETKRLLYDLSNRGQIFDALRLIFPFGEAWKEVATTWLRLVSENPKSIRTLQRTVEGARGAGWFQKDPQTDQEVFVIPGTPQLVETLTGVNGDMVGSVAGLSIASSVVPGVGPVVQFAAGAFLPEKPQFDTIREVIFQFGGEGEGIVSMLTPAWADKMVRATKDPESDRAFNNDVGYVLNALSASGDYDLTNPDDLIRLQEDAVDKARRLNILRGLVQFMAPSAPTPRTFLENATTQALLTRTLAEEFRKMQNEDYDTALERFIARFGEEALQAAIPMSLAEVYGLGASEQFGEFEQANRTLFKKYGLVAGLFAPESEDDDFSATVYDRQFRTGRRTSMTQNDRVAERNHILARLIYNQQKALLGDKPNEAQRDWLAEVKTDLINKYPGYTPEDFDPAKVPSGVRQLEKAAADPSMDGNPVAMASRFYFSQRALAVESIGKLSTLQRGKDAAYMRDWLRQVAASIIEQTPEFARVWDSLLSRELAENEPEQEAG